MEDMIQKLNAPCSVVTSFDHRTRTVKPVRVTFDGREHEINKIGFHHTYREGKILYHVFSVSSPTMFFRIVLDTETLHWAVSEIADNEVN